MYIASFIFNHEFDPFSSSPDQSFKSPTVLPASWLGPPWIQEVDFANVYRGLMADFQVECNNRSSKTQIIVIGDARSQVRPSVLISIDW
jgi:hypothetical protein